MLDLSAATNNNEWLEMLLTAAVRQRWSDLKFTYHLDTERTDTGEEGANAKLLVSARIHRKMQPVAGLQGVSAKRVMTGLKTASGISSGRAVKPEDGLYKFRPEGADRFIDIRVALFPTMAGDTMALRLPSTERLLEIDDLKMTAHNRVMLDRAMSYPNGLTLVAGPMGSGKSTTMRAILKGIGTDQRSVWAVEDPVELTIDGVEQIDINADAGNGWPEVLTAIRRSDLEVLMIGEIRNYEQASAALEIGNAGAQVLSSIHANDSVGAVLQLMELADSKPHTLGAQLRTVISQRLIRTMCETCAGIPGISCPLCSGTGFSGVRPVHEILILDDAFIDALANKASTTDLQAVAKSSGMRTLWECAQELIAEGVTTVEEVQGVLGRE